MTDDLISRQAILDAVDGVTWYHQNKNGEMVHGANSDEHQAWYKAEDIYKAIETVPSAQLAQDLTNGCTDTISRVAAISICDNAIDLWNGQLGTGALVAVRDAIMALPSAQPVVISKLENATECEDAVSREAVLNEIHRYMEERDYTIGLLDDNVCGLPPVTPKQPGWIPCSTALPKTEEKVLITCERLDIYGKPHRYVCKAFHVDRYTMRSDVDWWDEGCDEYREEDDQYYVLEGWYEYIHNWGDYNSVRISEDKVVAWCELPTPYREGRQNE